jgi:ribose/xylose/arabinose/galactoside ABC-type transport system permease subunit
MKSYRLYLMALSLLVIFMITNKVTIDPFIIIENSPLIFCALSTMLCLAMGKLDWSMGTIVAFSGIASLLSQHETGSLLCAYLGGLTAGFIIGGINGWMIGILRWPSLLATFGTFLVFSRINNFITYQKYFTDALASLSPINTSDSLKWLYGLLLFWLLVLIFVLKFSKLKLYTIAIGEDLAQALRFPEEPKVIIVMVYVLQGLTAGLTGTCLVQYQVQNVYQNHELLPLLALGACCCAGMKLKGGRPPIFKLACTLGIFLCCIQLFEFWSQSPYFAPWLNF